ncbi:hypothetical protein M885DRAFT_516605 [Pelagophyceae sp. CCMP2097]|nr:hypothetical protein M885DRAFT_516605 [Pelagophyceae sp. CCMP2097]|mmetsp:Transcript_31339/g.105537  ORF Transcript_31339/g.105537 Transcript_31339/m.105537 type:complete len:171 (-) Transcript_31339:110-622(-)|eukprot:CAMPEP_0184088246 /NCGR_PEP_ID=MMETSP0974-20121125/6125_1 /TAXON_ID=483370 /ORGANISM="non described non described, Strain CCMP2097" /LENGTH=170 /DNA_ID=CAMNT_0026390951 /DNA_START=72 /DNA_END=584 /DNA_ORIENTATION=+
MSRLLASRLAGALARPLARAPQRNLHDFSVLTRGEHFPLKALCKVEQGDDGNYELEAYDEESSRAIRSSINDSFHMLVCYFEPKSKKLVVKARRNPFQKPSYARRESTKFMHRATSLIFQDGGSWSGQEPTRKSELRAEKLAKQNKKALRGRFHLDSPNDDDFVRDLGLL